MPKALRWSDLLLAGFGLALMAAFWPGISGAATTPRWSVAALLCGYFFVMKPAPSSAAGTVGAFLMVWLLASLFWSQGALDGIDAAFKLSLACVAFAAGSTMDDLRPLFAGAAVGLAISSGVAVAQALGWHGIASIDDTPAGLFVNRDRMAAAAALVVIGGVALRQWWTVPLLLPALVLGNSRGAWLAVALGLIVLVKPSLWQYWRQTIVAIVGILAGVIAVHGLDLATSERLWIWRDTLSGATFFGHGLGSFRETFPTYLDAFAQSWSLTTHPSRPEHPHNELLWLLYEGGVPALLLGLAFAVAVYRSCAHVLRAVLAGLFVLAQFAMPLHDPASLVVGVVVAGFCAGRGALFRRLSFSCRDPLCEGVAAYERGGIDRPDGSGTRAVSV